MRFGAFLVAALLVAAGLAFFVSPQASSQPDGLNRVAIDTGFDQAEQPHAMADAPTAGYAVRGVADDRLATGLAGLIGVAATLVVTGGVVLVLRRFRPGTAPGTVA